MKHHNERLAALSRRLEPLWRVLAFLLRTKGAGRGWAKPQSILLVELHLLGDMVMLIPLLRVIRRFHPGARVGLMAGPWAHDVLADTGLVDEFIVLRAPWVSKGWGLQGWRDILSAVRSSRLRPWDWAIDVRGDVRNALLLALARASRRIAYNFTGGGALLTDEVPDDGQLRHIIDHHAVLAQYLGMPMTADERVPRLTRSSGAPPRVPPTGRPSRCLDSPRRIGFHFGASMALRRLPLGEACMLLEKYLMVANTRLLLVDAPEILDFNSKLLERLPPSNVERVERWRGSLPEFIDFLSTLDQFFAMDSGPAHLAAALGVRTIVFFGPHLSMAVRPSGFEVTVVERGDLACRPCDQHRCVNQTYQECLTGVVKLLRGDESLPGSVTTVDDALTRGTASLGRDLSGVA